METECDGCGFFTNTEEYHSQKPGGQPMRRLCPLCANTKVGNSIDYPEFYHDKEVMQQMNFLFNALFYSLGVSVKIPDWEK